jgi:hypothetical protein
MSSAMSDVPNDFVLCHLDDVSREPREMLPEQHPDHPVIGRYFISGMGGAIYYCDSYDPAMGFWMTPAREGDTYHKVISDNGRTNVSERAIGGTFHRIYRDDYKDGPLFSTGLINASLRDFHFEQEPHGGHRHQS